MFVFLKLPADWKIAIYELHNLMKLVQIISISKTNFTFCYTHSDPVCSSYVKIVFWRIFVIGKWSQILKLNKTFFLINAFTALFELKSVQWSYLNDKFFAS